MTPATFQLALTRSRLRSGRIVRACERVLIENWPLVRAAEEAGVAYQVLQRRVQRLRWLATKAEKP